MDLARALTYRAGALDHEESLLRADLAVAIALLARLGVRAGPRPRPVAGIARRRNVDRYLGGLAVIGLLQRDLHVVAEVRAATLCLTTAPAALPAHEFAEHAFEDVGKAAEILCATTATAVLERCVTETVVGGTLLRVLQDLIRFADRLELGLAVLAPGILVRMELHRQLAVRRFDDRRIRGSLAFEQLVIIDLRAHARPPPTLFSRAVMPAKAGISRRERFVCGARPRPAPG